MVYMKTMKVLIIAIFLGSFLISCAKHAKQTEEVSAAKEIAEFESNACVENDTITFSFDTLQFIRRYELTKRILQKEVDTAMLSSVGQQTDSISNLSGLIYQYHTDMYQSIRDSDTLTGEQIGYIIGLSISKPYDETEILTTYSLLNEKYSKRPEEIMKLLEASAYLSKDEEEDFLKYFAPNLFYGWYEHYLDEFIKSGELTWKETEDYESTFKKLLPLFKNTYPMTVSFYKDAGYDFDKLLIRE